VTTYRNRTGNKTIAFVGADANYLLRFRGPIMKRFVEKGYNVSAISPPSSLANPDQFSNLGVSFVEWSIKKSSLNVITEVVQIFSLYKILSIIRPNITFSHTIKSVIYCNLISRSIGVGRVVSLLPGLGYAFTQGGGIKRIFVRCIATLGYRIALGFADMAIFQNNDDLAFMRRVGALPSKTTTALVPGSGVDMTHFSRQPLRTGPMTFLMVARLLKDKGVGEFIEAARMVRAKHDGARFVMVGGADSNPTAFSQTEIDSWVDEGIVEAPGHIDDPRQYYADCHVFVLPSYREGIPRTNLEAMSTGRAIITTNAPGCRETVIDGLNGILVNARSAKSLADAMFALVENPERVASMGGASHALCSERFELNSVADLTFNLIEGGDSANPDRPT
jgi:glycosyltransferase involved in cell wall biosynthesis